MGDRGVEKKLTRVFLASRQNPTQGNIQRLTRANNASSAAINGESYGRLMGKSVLMRWEVIQ